MTQSKDIRLLAIDPTTKGFGFAVIESPDRLIDWGVKSASGHKPAKCLRKVRELLENYRPAVIVLEDYAAKGSRRCGRVKRLVERIRQLAVENRVKARMVSTAQVREAFAPASTKHEVAVAIGRRLPELAHCVPPVRKPWMTEHHSAAIFDAAGFALACLHLHESGHHPRH